jgi:isoaspartyl peptidase/L-asparaginase-like protein (Ntn-hydrolase superfamily)
VLLVGEGARIFALQQGFPLDTLHTSESVAEWYRRRPKPGAREQPRPPQGEQPRPPQGEQPRPPQGQGGAQDHRGGPNDHDTVTVLALDQKGNLGGVCSTSGLSHKLPGRVGDSPLIGHGLYVDNTAGAAGATGVGEEIIRINGSFFVVEAMRAGRSPQEACELAVRKVNALAVRRGVHPAHVAFIALDVKGRTGAAATTQTNFQYAVGRGEKVELQKAAEFGPAPR